MSSEPRPKRFIAGAVCPRCGAQDRVRVFSVDGTTHRDCVACGFNDILEEVAGDDLPQGRLDGPSDLIKKPAAGGAQPLQFHPPKLRRKDPGADDSGGS